MLHNDYLSCKIVIRCSSKIIRLLSVLLQILILLKFLKIMTDLKDIPQESQVLNLKIESYKIPIILETINKKLKLHIRSKELDQVKDKMKTQDNQLID